MNARDLKTQIQNAIADSAVVELRFLLRQLWNAEPSAASAAWIPRQVANVKEGLSLQPIRAAFLRSFTVEPAVQMFVAASLTNGFHVEPYIGPFNTYSQDLLDANSDLYRFEPQVTFLAALTRSIAPELWHDFAKQSDEESEQTVQRVIDQYRSLITAFRNNSSGSLVVHTLEQPIRAAHGISDAHSNNSQRSCIRRINDGLRLLSQQSQGVYLLDYGNLIHRFGADRWEDADKWDSMRLPMSGGAISVLANEWSRYLHPLTSSICKALVCDLDNTLWHGVVGEEGFEGVQMGESGRGAPFRRLQRVLLDLYHRGIILAICSKNNHDEAWRVVESHPDMLLRPEHFAAARINWEEKSQNLREIAAELNIGLDSLAFLDDNPRERHSVRVQLPEVAVLEVPDNPASLASAVGEEPRFERLQLNLDDRHRGAMYFQQRQRHEAQRQSTDLTSYLRSLETTIERVPVSSLTVDRIAQLTQKTNQFNLTTRRYQPQEIVAFNDSVNHEVYGFRVADRFGDNGTVGVAILDFENDACRLDTFLLSCRVIGRSVDTAMLAIICRDVESLGNTRIRGCYVPTEKNMPCQDFFERHRFEYESKIDSWILHMPERSVSCPGWIHVCGANDSAREVDLT